MIEKYYWVSYVTWNEESQFYRDKVISLHPFEFIDKQRQAFKRQSLYKGKCDVTLLNYKEISREEYAMYNCTKDK